MNKKSPAIFFIAVGLCFLLMGCTARKPVSSYSSGDQQYEQQKIVISGDIEKSQEITVAEMRQLPQQELAGSFQRTTGLREEFDACGPSLEDVLARRGINAHDYKGIGFAGQDGYYCLITPEIMQNRTLILALAIDGKNQLARDMRPARLCAQGEFGPYWVRMVNKIILYKEIPKKEISSVWIFNNLVQGIEPYPYEYYGSKDNAIELALILSRFDNVNNRAFFTMKSADGFIKHEALNMVSKDYYIKIAGKDAPMNIAPNIKLGMNVKNIAWFSTNADAAVFPDTMRELVGTQIIAGRQGIALGEMLEEVQLTDMEDRKFDLMGTGGESVRVGAGDLAKGVLVMAEDGSYPVVWAEGSSMLPVRNLMRIKVVK